jgi:hypothetical protein
LNTINFRNWRVYLSLLLLLTLVLASGSLWAASLTDTSLTLSDPRTSLPSNYRIQATGFSTSTAIGCVEVNLNTQADGSGVSPSAITTTTSTYNGTSLTGLTAWSVDNATNGTLRATNGSPETPTSSSGYFEWGNITNGDTEGTAYYAIITTYTLDDCTTPVDNAVMAFVYRDGELVSLEIGTQLTFDIVGVLAGQSVNGATTDTLSDATGINYGTVTSSSTATSAHDLQVSTNAAGGYTVYIRHQEPFQTIGGSTITWSSSPGSNTTPLAFPSAGTEAWGYTTEDSSLSTGSGAADRFTSSGGNKWARFETSNEEVIYNTVGSGTVETTRVGHQVSIADSTPAGTYQTTIIYTVVATY